MPKSNRKGYFLNQLKNQGIQNQNNLALKKKGVKKQAKIAAKQARQRKKKYIQHLQHRLVQLTTQLQAYKRQTKILKQQIKKLSSSLQNMHRNITLQQAQLKTNIILSIPPIQQKQKKEVRFQGLLKEIKNLSLQIQRNNNEEISRTLSVLRDKYGISGRERLKYIDDMFDSIVGIMMPMHYRLLMEHCLDSRSFYLLLSSQFTNHNLIKLQDRIRQILVNMRPQIVRQRQQYDHFLSTIAQIRTKLKAQNYKCQTIVDEIEDRIDATFVGRLLLDLDFCRAKQNLQAIYPMNYWNKCKQDGMELIVPPTRMVQNYGNKNHGSQKKEEILFSFEDDMEILHGLFS